MLGSWQIQRRRSPQRVLKTIPSGINKWFALRIWQKILPCVVAWSSSLGDMRSGKICSGFLMECSKRLDIATPISRYSFLCRSWKRKLRMSMDSQRNVRSSRITGWRWDLMENLFPLENWKNHLLFDQLRKRSSVQRMQSGFRVIAICRC